MRVVVDTNVFVSGIYWKGPPYQILRAWSDRKIKLVLSPLILGEYIRVAIELSSKFPEIDLFPIIGLLFAEGEICLPNKLPSQICRDPEDDQFIACAIKSGSKFIISGDRSLLETSGYGGIQVLNPRDFVVNYLK